MNPPVATTSQSVALSIAAGDVSAPWQIPAKLRDMQSLWRKMTRPEDWSLKDASLGNARAQEEARYISETYDYVDEQYDGSNWTHHMAMVWAILFSRVVPFISHDKHTTYTRTTDTKEATRIVRAIRWKKAAGRRGVTDPRPYIVMVSTAILALRDRKSPLSRQAAKNKNALCKPWTDKHGKRKRDRY